MYNSYQSTNSIDNNTTQSPYQPTDYVDNNEI